MIHRFFCLDTQQILYQPRQASQDKKLDDGCNKFCYINADLEAAKGHGSGHIKQATGYTCLGLRKNDLD